MRAAGVFVAVAATLLAFAGLGMTGHMAAHMAAVAVAAPLLAFPRTTSVRAERSRGMLSSEVEKGLGFARLDPSTSLGANGVLAWAMVEFVVVWAWHAPALRDAADMSPVLALVEQALFLAVGVGLWRAAFAAPAAGVAALLLTSMHMTLLGVLIGLAPQPLYPMMAMHAAPGLDALTDQQLGGVVMLVVGGASYCLGGLWMLGQLLRARAA